MSPSSRVIYISERSAWGRLGYKAVLAAFPSTQPVFWSRGDTPKPDISGWHGDWIISFKSDLVLPCAILKCAEKAAINFHPGPPKYRGVGGYWWALHNGDDIFGATCHHMDKEIDHGAIITTKSFSISPEETVENLKNKTAAFSLELLKETLDTIISGKPLTLSGAKWREHLYTYRELDEAQRVATANNSRDPEVHLKALQTIHDGLVSLGEVPTETSRADHIAKPKLALS